MKRERQGEIVSDVLRGMPAPELYSDATETILRELMEAAGCVAEAKWRAAQKREPHAASVYLHTLADAQKRLEALYSIAAVVLRKPTLPELDAAIADVQRRIKEELDAISP